MHTISEKFQYFDVQNKVRSCVDDILKLQFDIDDLLHQITPNATDVFSMKTQWLLRRNHLIYQELVDAEEQIPNIPETSVTRLLITQNQEILKNQEKILQSLHRCFQENNQKRNDVIQTLIEIETKQFKALLETKRHG